MNQERLAERVAGRLAAQTIIGLIREECGQDNTQNWADGFWDEMDEFIARTDNGRPAKKETGPAPMTATEAVRFEGEYCPFKKYQSWLVANVPLGYLDYLVGLQTDPDAFVNRAARYLKNPQVAERLREELLQGSPWNNGPHE